MVWARQRCEASIDRGEPARIPETRGGAVAFGVRPETRGNSATLAYSATYLLPFAL
jgi:hypothetical protein